MCCSQKSLLTFFIFRLRGSHTVSINQGDFRRILVNHSETNDFILPTFLLHTVSESTGQWWEQDGVGSEYVLSHYSEDKAAAL